MIKSLKIGDSAWLARCTTKQINLDCPCCFGKKHITVVLGNDEKVVVGCDFCGDNRYSGALGYITEYQWIAEPDLVTINEIRSEQTVDGEKSNYSGYNFYCEDKDLFSTKEEAQEECEKRIKIHIEEEKKRIEWGKEKSNKSYSWHVGYHRREIKKLERDLEYHKLKLDAMKKLSKNEEDKV